MSASSSFTENRYVFIKMKAISTVVLFAVMAIAFAQEAPSEGTDDSARGRPSGGFYGRPPYGGYRPRPGTGWQQRPPTGFPGSGTGQISQPGIIWPGNQWQPGVIPQFPGINQPGIIPQFPGNQPGVIPQFPGNNPAFPGSGTRPLSPILVGNDPQTGNPPAGSGTRPLSPILIGDVPQTGNPPAGTGPGQTAPTLPGTDDGTLDSIVPAPAPGGSSLDDGARLTLGQPLRPSIGPFFTPEITLDGAFYDWLQQLLEDEIIEGSIAEGRPENST